MAEETFVVLLLSFSMAVITFVCGNVPLKLKLSEETLRKVTLLGAGLLVGTAFTVIIPEGIRSLYTKYDIKTSDTHTKFNEKETSTNAQSIVDRNKLLIAHDGHDTEDYSRTIGLSLVLGFVFMMLVDQISQKYQSPTKEKNITATLGLVVHAAADGVALGAAATTSHQDVEIIVFLAIMLHKAPAAFGLVTFLLHEKIDRVQIRKHLAIFSLSAPLLTILTYFGIGQEQKETLNSVNATGIAMLFSGGTFLYVATVHVLPELTIGSHGGNRSNHSSNQYEYGIMQTAGSSIESGNLLDISKKQTTQLYISNGLSYKEIATIVCGALLPLIITFSHSH